MNRGPSISTTHRWVWTTIAVSAHSKFTAVERARAELKVPTHPHHQLVKQVAPGRFSVQLRVQKG